MHLTDLPTPMRVLRRLTSAARPATCRACRRRRTRAGMRLRPHAKTHKSPRVAALQIERGAVGICCAKLGEAEVFADDGIADIRLPYPLNPVNADRVFALARARPAVVHRRRSGRRATRGRGSRRRAARSSTCWSRWTSASIAAGSIRSRRRRPAPCARSRRCRGCASAGCSATRATATARRPRRGVEAVAVAEAQTLRDLAAASGVRVRRDQRRRDADGAVLGASRTA